MVLTAVSVPAPVSKNMVLYRFIRNSKAHALFGLHRLKGSQSNCHEMENSRR